MRLRMGTTLLPGGAGKYVLCIDPACPRCQEPLNGPTCCCTAKTLRRRGTTSKLHCTPMD
ncbi:hypothetical protein DPMN_142457 [Dreissena polymorpha]|uniref:Uncharacterized protein n=1 Tax=Dreissena polymorpha TaxID=45954 RepID=A0A9D4JNH5_DREPO|nr:hypothetical protein DPMN_142457 [Dreissena polymorpha]